MLKKKCRKWIDKKDRYIEKFCVAFLWTHIRKENEGWSQRKQQNQIKPNNAEEVSWKWIDKKIDA